MEAPINEFQPFKAPGLDGLYPVLLQKAWNQLKGYYHVIFQACLRHSYVPSAWKKGAGIFLLKPGKAIVLGKLQKNVEAKNGMQNVAKNTTDLLAVSNM